MGINNVPSNVTKRKIFVLLALDYLLSSVLIRFLYFSLSLGKRKLAFSGGGLDWSVGLVTP
jgi:hypothetical protein